MGQTRIEGQASQPSQGGGGPAEVVPAPACSHVRAKKASRSGARRARPLLLGVGLLLCVADVVPGLSWTGGRGGLELPGGVARAQVGARQEDGSGSGQGLKNPGGPADGGLAEEGMGDEEGPLMDGPIRRSNRIEFDERLIKGQTASSGAVYLFQRAPRRLPGLVPMRRSYLRRIVAPVLGPQALESLASEMSEAAQVGPGEGAAE